MKTLILGILLSDTQLRLKDIQSSNNNLPFVVFELNWDQARLVWNCGNDALLNLCASSVFFAGWGEGFFGREESGGGGKNSLTISDYIMNLNLFLRQGLQQQQQQQQQLNPVMIDSTSNRNTNTSTMRSAVLRASHQRTNPTDKKRKNIKCVKIIRRRFVSLGKQPTFCDATRH